MHICIGVITRDRPQMLADLLASLQKLELDDGVSTEVIVVENNTEKTLGSLIAEFGDNTKITYEFEPQLGIAFARNRVLEISLELGGEFTAFVDDDEIVDPAWLAALFTGITTRKLDLVGGQVRVVEPLETPTWLQSMIWSGLRHRNDTIEQTNKARHDADDDHEVILGTGSWMVRNAFLQRSGLRFDESLGFSSGEDAAFFWSSRRLGAKTGWCPTAIAVEAIPLTRLEVGYQFKRARSEAIASFQFKYPKPDVGIIMRSAIFASSKLVAAIFLLLSAPFTRGRTLANAIRNFGLAIGRVSALGGRKSDLYKQIQGQ